MLRLLGASGFLSDVLIRQGANWPEVFHRQIHTASKSAAAHIAELGGELTASAPPASVASALRRHKQLEYLRIGARDLRPEQQVEETMTELSALADGALEIAYRCCRATVEADFGALALPGTEAPQRFVILGMGKLGGGELNFSSDIDLIYLYEEDEGESTGGAKGKCPPREFFSRIAETITRAMGEITDEGFVFRTDLRLRPFGTQGPIVQSLPSALTYYEAWGQTWERSALIKARPVAGDAGLGEQFLRDVEPFVYRRYLDFSTVEELRQMKARIEHELLGPRQQERNVKLGYGGIREIEFFTQALQLLNGGHNPAVRDANTLRALAHLLEQGFIPQSEERSLSAAYRFLRQVEHKIQMVQEAHSHTIPEGNGEQTSLARRLGYTKVRGKSERALFWSDFHKQTAAVRAAFDRLFHGAEKEMRAEGLSRWETVWNRLDDEARAVEDLAALGFPDAARAYRDLLMIRDGDEPPSPRRLRIMNLLGPALIEAAVHSPAADRAVFNLAELSRRLGGRTGFLSLLAENPKTMHLLVELFAGSQYLTDLFLERRELIDSLIRADLITPRKGAAEIRRALIAGAAAGSDLEAKLNALRRGKSEELLRIGVHDLGNELSLAEIFDELTQLADACLDAALGLAFEEIAQKHGEVPKGRFAVLGMGKLGGREIDYGSDLDLIFVYDAPEEARSTGAAGPAIDAHDYYVRLGQKLITFLTAAMEEGVLYRIDMRLRPSGRAGPVVSSLAAFRQYHETSSELWERQALIKLRAAAGDASLGGEAEGVARAFAYGRMLTAEDVRMIDHLRMRMEKELAQENAERFNLKKGMGGLVDIEFLTQMLQLRHGRAQPRIQTQSTLAAIKALSDENIVTAEEYRVLSDGYLFLRRLDHRLRLERNESLDILDRDPARLEQTALGLGYKGKKDSLAGKRLLRDYEKLTTRIRRAYEKRFKSNE
ncbi:MAG TPA: bifunctional [glutamate--ammonia ligase]-adenylyl-L-tyrosine phosphorylase/[glutamate--ammonia-ligase] adenylyltransferase [Verrucomicrobiae bacterium]|nr:bifunctional [glutamate--ammonia ligase]-adenylyl-L-tyrosine phosphorylase/[glutamate--ammonia-ligase] adenylyltransferase [Verrucomicrobiae bacterium]